MFKKLFLIIGIIASGSALHAMEPAEPVYAPSCGPHTTTQAQHALCKKVMAALDGHNLDALTECFNHGFDLKAKSILSKKEKNRPFKENQTLLYTICDKLCVDPWYMHALKLFFDKGADPNMLMPYQKKNDAQDILNLSPAHRIIENLYEIPEDRVLEALTLFQKKGCTFDLYPTGNGTLDSHCLAKITRACVRKPNKKHQKDALDSTYSKIVDLILSSITSHVAFLDALSAHAATAKENQYLKTFKVFQDRIDWIHQLYPETDPQKQPYFVEASEILNRCINATQDNYLKMLPGDLHKPLCKMVARNLEKPSLLGSIKNKVLSIMPKTKK